ncbi:MAG: ABC transporter ATP-binding protein, partial [Proteobacteria bacterium]|nr:ABC transporter ATP-binding protein [Pseudomonadota bacterium]
MATNPPTLRVENLETHFFTKAGVVKAVNGVSFTVERAQILGLVGESGSGKSVTGFSILGLVDPPGRVVGGRIEFQGEDIANAGEARMRALRGNRIAMIFQDPLMTLNPVLRIDTQMIEAVQAAQMGADAVFNNTTKEWPVAVDAVAAAERKLRVEIEKTQQAQREASVAFEEDNIRILAGLEQIGEGFFLLA